MATKSSAAADVTRPSLSFTRRLKAPPAKVYAAWTDPQKIIRWFGRSDAKPNSFHAEIDARIGGHFRVSFSTADEYYEIGEDGLYLTGTSEVALAGLHMGEILEAEALPLRYTAFVFRQSDGKRVLAPRPVALFSGKRAPITWSAS